jgi:hypothetical protein
LGTELSAKNKIQATGSLAVPVLRYMQYQFIVPLKSLEQRFTVYKIIVLPERVSSGKFIQYIVDYAYFGLNDNQRDYIIFTEAQYN